MKLSEISDAIRPLKNAVEAANKLPPEELDAAVQNIISGFREKLPSARKAALKQIRELRKTKLRVADLEAKVAKWSQERTLP